MSVKLISVELSANPNTQIVESVEGINGQLNKTSDGALFCVVRFEDSTNPMKLKRAIRTYRQNAGKWPGVTPAVLKTFAGKVIDWAKFETKTVEPYTITNSQTGQQNECTTYTTVVLEGENVNTVFRNAGHPVMTEEGEIIEPVSAIHQ